MATFSATSADSSYVEPGGVCGGKAPCFTSIGAGVASAAVATTVHVAEGDYSEDIDLDAAKLVIFQGGWDEAFGTRTARTTARSLAVGQGKIIVFNLVLGP